MLNFSNIAFAYSGHTGRTEPLEALHNLNLSVDRGESLALIGPSGCGKSTLLLLAAGLLKPSSGKLTICQEELCAPRLGTALILQDFGLLPWKTVLENAALGLEIRHRKKAERSAIAQEALKQVGIADFAQVFPNELSGGMRQRLALARALALDVDVMLMDEPLSAVDTMLRENLQDLLLQLWQERGFTQIMVTHSIEEAVFLGQRIAIMSARPGTIDVVIENLHVGDLHYRHEEAYFSKCREVRVALRDQDASQGASQNVIQAVSQSANQSVWRGVGQGAYQGTAQSVDVSATQDAGQVANQGVDKNATQDASWMPND